jgi:hypothetical protein
MAVPTSCPDPAEISVSVHVNLPDVYPEQVGDGLNCTYVDVAQGDRSKGVTILFGQAGDSVKAWSAGLKSAIPSAASIPGVGDAAFYFVDVATGTTALYFKSGPVAVHITSGIGSPRKDLVALAADQILVPDN